MRTRPGRRALLVSLAVLLLAGFGFTVSALSAPTKPDLSLQVSPANQSVTRGQNATFTVSVTSVNGLIGSASLAASGLPAGSTTAFNPTAVTLASGSTQTSTMTVSTTSTTPIGTANITITGTSGKVSNAVAAGLTVNYPLSGSLTLTSNPSTSTINPGATAVYSLTVGRTNMANAAVGLTVANVLPSGASSTFTPNPISGSGTTSSVQISSTSATPTGSYTVYLVASGKDSNGATQYAYASVTLVVSTSGKPFTITSDAISGLAPGVSSPLNLTMTNTNNSPLAISNLTVTVSSVSKAAGVTKACTTADYAVTQYNGPYPLAVAKNGSASLLSLGVTPAQWPQVRMLNTNQNQDGCKGATLTLAYSGSGSGS